MTSEVIVFAFSGPGPRFPSHCSIALNDFSRVGLANGSIYPLFIISINDGKRKTPWDKTPHNEFSEKISAQGRITIPPAYREYANLYPGKDVVVVGCEIGVEIWSQERWAEELEKMNEHVREKGEREMSADLLSDEFNKERDK